MKPNCEICNDTGEVITLDGEGDIQSCPPCPEGCKKPESGGELATLTEKKHHNIFTNGDMVLREGLNLIKHTITKEDMEMNPQLAKEGIEVGQVIELGEVTLDPTCECEKNEKCSDSTCAVLMKHGKEPLEGHDFCHGDCEEKPECACGKEKCEESVNDDCKCMGCHRNCTQEENAKCVCGGSQKQGYCFKGCPINDTKEPSAEWDGNLKWDEDIVKSITGKCDTALCNEEGFCPCMRCEDSLNLIHGKIANAKEAQTKKILSVVEELRNYCCSEHYASRDGLCTTYKESPYLPMNVRNETVGLAIEAIKNSNQDV